MFPRVAGARHDAEGGALFVPRDRQGVGRHDNPEHYGALYLTRSPVSAVAERIQGFRGQSITDADLRRKGTDHLALVAFDEGTLDALVDLDDPHELAARTLRPSRVATRERVTTQAIALGLFAEGHTGFTWWSALEASWTNVTLFAERVGGRPTFAGDPEPLTIAHPALRAAAEALGVRLGR